MTLEKGGIHISLNVGMLNADSARLSRSLVEPVLRKVEEQFAAKNPGDQLTLILDQPQDALFIMERGSRRYRGQRLPENFFLDRSSESLSARMFQRVIPSVIDRTDYTVHLKKGELFFRRSGLALYAGGQVHYDLVFLSDPILRDFESADYCPALNEVDRLGNRATDDLPLLLSSSQPEVYRSPGRSALDGMAVFARFESPVVIEALSILLGPRSPCSGACREGDCLRLSPDRRTNLRLLAVLNGEGGSKAQIHADCKDMTTWAPVSLLPVQDEMLNDSKRRLVQFCENLHQL